MKTKALLLLVFACLIVTAIAIWTYLRSSNDDTNIGQMIAVSRDNTPFRLQNNEVIKLPKGTQFESVASNENEIYGYAQVDGSRTFGAMLRTDKNESPPSVTLDPSKNQTDMKVAFNRIAIISSREVQETGIADLLTVELSSLPHTQLVERDELQKAMAELELSSLANSASLAQRLQLGKTLDADVLVILQLQQREEKQFIKLVICDTKYGARLRVEYIPWVEANPELVSTGSRLIVQEVRRHFSAGIEQLVTVPHFVSKNLVHDYDHFQTGYAHLLENALAIQPGVAVVETEEARLIDGELKIGDRELQERITPVFVAGEFEMTQSPMDTEPTARILIDVKRSQQPGTTLEKKDLTPEQVAKYLTTQVPQAVLKTEDDNPPAGFSRIEQFNLLLKRAEMFSSLGDWRTAISLREAALLLDPTHRDLHLQIIEDYRFLVREKPHELTPEMFVPGNPQLAAAARTRVEAYRAVLMHVEYLIRHRLITDSEAVELVQQNTTHLLLESFPMAYTNVDGKYWRPGQDELAESEVAEAKFIERVVPLIPSLPADLSRDESKRRALEIRIAQDVYQLPITTHSFRIDRSYRTLEDLAELRRQLLKDAASISMPANILGYQHFYRHVESPTPEFVGEDAITEQQWVEFLQGLASGDHQNASFIARFDLLKFNAGERGAPFLKREASAEVLEDVIAKCNQLLSDYNEALADSDMTSHDLNLRNEVFVANLLNYRNDLEAGIHGGTLTVQARPRKQGVDSSKSGKVIGRLKFEPLRVKVHFMDGREEEHPLFGSLISAGPGLDIYWTRFSVLFMQQRGVLKQVYLDDDGVIDDVAWDGRHVWIATRKSEINVLDKSGEIFTKVGEAEGLPPFDQRVRIHAIETGKVCVVGSFGKQLRAWCAMVEMQDKGVTASVFHQATHVPGEMLTAEDTKRTDTVFKPDDTFLYQGGDHPEGLLLVDRGELLRGPYVQRVSGYLVIDLKTLKVTRADDLRYRLSNSFNSTLSFNMEVLSNGDIIGATPFYVDHFTVADLEAIDKLPQKNGVYLNNGLIRPTNQDITDADFGKLIRQGDWIYVPGNIWYRIHADSKKVEPLLREAIPDRYNMYQHGLSAHYGLIGWTESQKLWESYQISVLESSIEQAPRDYELEKLASPRAEIVEKEARFPLTAKCVTYSPDGKILAAGGSGLAIQLWKTEDYSPLRALRGQSLIVNSLCFSPDGKTLVSGEAGSENRQVKIPLAAVRIWDVETGQLLHTLQKHTGGVLAVDVSPDGNTIASAGEDGMVYLWDLQSGDLINEIKAHKPYFARDVTFSPDGRMLASCGNDERIRLWDAVSGQALQVLEGHTHEVNNIAFSPEGDTLASGSRDGTAQLWDVESSDERAVLWDASPETLFTPDGESLITLGWQGMKVWSAADGSLQAKYSSNRHFSDSAVISPDGTSLAQVIGSGGIFVWELTHINSK